MICFEKNFIKTCQILEVFGAKKLRQIVGHIKLADIFSKWVNMKSIAANLHKFHLKFLYTGCRSKNLHPSHKMTQITRKLSNITIYIYMCYFRGMHANSASAPCKPFANFDRISTTWKPFTNFDRIDKICMIYITISNYMSHFKGTNSASAPCKPFANFGNIRTL